MDMKVLKRWSVLQERMALHLLSEVAFNLLPGKRLRSKR